MFDIIRKPTKISAGAVANEGIATNIGASNVERRKSTAVVIAVRPVLPPALTPEADSTKVVIVDVPKMAPAVVAMASDNNTGLIFSSLPFSSSIFAFEATPIIVPNVSKISTKRNANTITIRSMMLMEEKSRLKHCPKVVPKVEKSVIVNEGKRL